MAIEKMRLLRIAGSKQNLEQILITAFSCKELHAELAAHVINEGNGGTLMKEDSTYEEYLGRIESTARSLHIELKETYEPGQVFACDVLEDCLHEVEEHFEKINEQLMNMSGLMKEDKEAIERLREYDFSHMSHCHFTVVNFGRLPLASLAKMDAADNALFCYDILNKNNQYAWVLYTTLQSSKKTVETLLHDLYFEPVAIPTIDDHQLIAICQKRLEEIYGYVKRQAEMHKLYKYIALFNDECVITGFVPSCNAKAFKMQFKDMEDVIIQDFPSGSEEGLEPPTKLKNGWFTKPFELFVEMYGLPHYADFDPTSFLAFTYCLLFGIMFGDLGQGFVFLVGGFLLYKKKKMVLAAVVSRLGFFSMIFGLVYGSVFGNEELLNPFYINILGLPSKPIHTMDTNMTLPLLIAAVSIGATLILCSIAYNIYGKLRRKNVAEAIFDQNGLCGFIFYGSICAGVFLEMGLKIKVVNPITLILFIGLPLLCILMRVPLKNFVNKVTVKPHEGWGGYIMESIFELLEVALSFMTNTMSFLRVGGFILSHAGMMIVVMHLNDMLGNAGIIALVIGNIFVMGLEGLIVGIQTLRLEYYEMFSRYYSGGGKKYLPTSAKY